MKEFIKKYWKWMLIVAIAIVIIYVAYKKFVSTPTLEPSTATPSVGGGSNTSTAPRTSTTTSTPAPTSGCVTTYNNTASIFPLKEGSKGSHVKQLQRFLNTNNNAALCVDGDWGPKTSAAVSAYKVPVQTLVGMPGSTITRQAVPNIIDLATFNSLKINMA